MNQMITIGLAALLVGGAGGFLVGSAGNGGDEGANKERVVTGAKIRRDGGRFAGGDEDRPRRNRTTSTTEAMREPGQLARMQGLIDLYAGMSASELENEVGELDALPFGDRVLASVLLFSRWAEIDPYGALAQTDKMGMGGMFAKPTVLRSWASMDPVNAAKYFTENPSEFGRMGGGRGPGGDSGSSVIAREWAKNDPQAALEWANTLEGRDKSSALVSVVGELAATDPSAAAAMAAGLDEDSQGRAFSEVAEQWARQDFDAAEAWINTLDGEARQDALASAIDVLSSTDPEGAATKVTAMDTGDARDRAIVDVASNWSKDNPSGAAEWLIAQETDDADDAMRRVMGNWVGQDSSGALSFIESQPAGEVRDSAASTYLWMNRDGDTGSSMALAESITDERDRSRAISMTARRWMSEDEAGAKAYVEQSDSLSDEAKQRILSGDGGGRGGRGRGR